MTKKISTLATSYTLFLMLATISGYLDGALSVIVGYLSFLIPVVFALYMSKGENSKKSFLSIEEKNLTLSLPLFAPVILITLVISYLTSRFIFIITGKTNEVNVGNSFVAAVIFSALLPAVLEEILFRYLPLKLISPHSRRAAIILSAVFFSLAHRNLFVIPYALFAGFAFMLIDLAFDSVIPSVLLHFTNNLLSVGVLIFNDNLAFAPIIYSLLIIFSIISAVFILLKKNEYKEKFAYATEKGEGLKIEIGVIIFVVAALCVSVINFV